MLFRYVESSRERGVIVSSLNSWSKFVPVRVHSSCIFSETLSATDCDCRSQLESSMAYIAQHGGHIVYLYDEGRGTGLANKFRAVELQIQNGWDTATAFAELGLPKDPRDFAVAAAAVLQMVSDQPVGLLTNNPRKVRALSAFGVNVVRRIPLVVPESLEARRYLLEKINVLGHLPLESGNDEETDETVPEPWPAHHSMVELHVDDFTPIIEFYTSLGFEEVWQRPAEDDKGYLVLKFERNILCFWAGNDAMYEQSHFRNYPRDTPRGYGVEIVLMVSRIDSFYDVVTSQTTTATSLRRRAWGLRDFRFTDPYGFYIRATEIHSITDPRYAVP